MAAIALPGSATESYFDDSSMLRRVHREYAVALSGPRALLMQAAHPVAFEGFFAHTGALDEPYERLARTAAVMNTIAFGSRAASPGRPRRWSSTTGTSRRCRRPNGPPTGRTIASSAACSA